MNPDPSLTQGYLAFRALARSDPTVARQILRLRDVIDELITLHSDNAGIFTNGSTAGVTAAAVVNSQLAKARLEFCTVVRSLTDIVNQHPTDVQRVFDLIMIEAKAAIWSVISDNPADDDPIDGHFGFRCTGVLRHIASLAEASAQHDPLCVKLQDCLSVHSLAQQPDSEKSLAVIVSQILEESGIAHRRELRFYARGRSKRADVAIGRQAIGMELKLVSKRRSLERILNELRGEVHAYLRYFVATIVVIVDISGLRYRPPMLSDLGVISPRLDLIYRRLL